MSFRRSAKAAGSDSSRWRRANRSRLILCGIPAEVADCDRRWWYVLEHGYDPGTGWDQTWMSPAQAADLLRALDGGPAAQVGPGSVMAHVLRHRYGFGDAVIRDRPEVFGERAG